MTEKPVFAGALWQGDSGPKGTNFCMMTATWMDAQTNTPSEGESGCLPAHCIEKRLQLFYCIVSHRAKCGRGPCELGCGLDQVLRNLD